MTVSVTPDWLRQRGADCDRFAEQLGQQRGPGLAACDALSGAAEGWEFKGSLDQLADRWEDLNKLLEQRMSKVADNFRDSGGNWDDHENGIVEFFRGLFG
ncbi:hypothetical protein F4556_003705 [Kitasatospora gansuensis]|uniref:Excreted virulence factor EspC (Type VII ESX diderm) n=1 Tax=Kitasatospora gansuensis TaxID=258050 RepID=A0A7W7SCZ4_9ACTN|nr:hypothetical protein [Kitasatospora gansuensis]MBB4948170.1 hypothetical protein [Kitasatospora gansuensis]